MSEWNKNDGTCSSNWEKDGEECIQVKNQAWQCMYSISMGGTNEKTNLQSC